jgi:ATP-dependent helicase/nuclease subunit A
VNAVPLPDQEARDRILRELDTNLLVEAGAGSGKTTALVGRMLQLVRRDVPVDQIAAVTFTRKAAGELSRKFREELETALREVAGSGDSAESRLDDALRDVDRAFVGTIHAFCARLLRERPLSARVDPRFLEVSGVEEKRLQDGYWAHWLDDLHAREDPTLDRLREVGLAPQELRDAFRLVAGELSDVDLPADPVARPDFAHLRNALDALLERADRLRPAEAIDGRRDNLQTLVGRLEFLRNTTDWSRPAHFFAALETMSENKCKVTQMLWSPDKEGKAVAKRLGQDFLAYVAGPVTDGLREWYAHRYGVVLDFLLPLRTAFEAHRRSTGRLTFQDLLILAARLLREDPDARRELGQRYERLLVDEFQDTDPLQAEVCLLLASDPAGGTDWRTVQPRPGALFVVGDPKQSIYRFRRADIEIYENVRQRFVPPNGDVVELTCNFRSRPRIGEFVDMAFKRLFPAKADVRQAAFAPFNAQQGEAPRTGVYRYEIRPDGGNKREIGEADARAVASWIAAEVESGRGRPGDFLIVPFWKEALSLYAREVERRNLPVTVTGADLTAELELGELLVLLRALADPGNEILTLAVLEGLFFGIDPQDLWRHSAGKAYFSFEGDVPDPSSAVGVALAKLREWADLCRQWPIDAALTRIVSEIGLLPLAAGGGMAESRAGALAHALEVVNAAACGGAADLSSAIIALDALRESRDVEAPLRPGRPDCVRVMNLHKAKGLEASIVVLAYPAGDRPIEPDHRVERSGGRAVGWCEFRVGRDGRILGRPRDWDTHAALEADFLAAERVRLLYVATTRAREMLVVGECPDYSGKSTWRPLSPELGSLATPLAIPITALEPRRKPTVTASEIEARVAAVDAARSAATAPAFDLVSVTEAVRGQQEDEGRERLVFRGAEGRGREWGTLLHRAVAAMGRGRSGESLRRYCRAMLLAERRPCGTDGEPTELAELLAVLGGVRSAPVWAELRAAGSARWELTVTKFEPGDGNGARLVGGVMDAVGMDAACRPVCVVDWKTDAVPEAEWAARLRAYERQVSEYVRILRDLAGGSPRGVIERLGVQRSGAAL